MASDECDFPISIFGETLRDLFSSFKLPSFNIFDELGVRENFLMFFNSGGSVFGRGGLFSFVSDVFVVVFDLVVFVADFTVVAFVIVFFTSSLLTF